MFVNCLLDDIMFSVIAIGSKVRVFKPGQGVGFLRATKTRCTRPLGGEEKPEAPCGKM
jgi:hypothetical protein